MWALLWKMHGKDWGYIQVVNRGMMLVLQGRGVVAWEPDIDISVRDHAC